jgi:hypothetical protein
MNTALSHDKRQEDIASKSQAVASNGRRKSLRISVSSVLRAHKSSHASEKGSKESVQSNRTWLTEPGRYCRVVLIPMAQARLQPISWLGVLFSMLGVSQLHSLIRSNADIAYPNSALGIRRADFAAETLAFSPAYLRYAAAPFGYCSDSASRTLPAYVATLSHSCDSGTDVCNNLLVPSVDDIYKN